MEILKFRLDDWRTNASIIGLMNILDNDKRGQYEIKRDKFIDYLEVPLSSLDNFEYKYFNYFIDKYEEDLPWKRLVDQGHLIENFSKEELSEFDEADLKELNKIIDLYKDYLSRPNYKKVYKFIDDKRDIEKDIKELKKIKKRKKDSIEDLHKDIEKNIKILLSIYNYCKSDKARTYLGAKGAIYGHINNGIDGVSFLNPQTKELDPYEDYKKYFIEELRELKALKKEKFKYTCFSCESGIDKMGNSGKMNLIKFTGIDDGKKTNHLWNENKDTIICKKCLFLFSCLPAGFNYKFYEGIFINANSSIEILRDTNRAVRKELEHIVEFGKGTSYRALLYSIRQKLMDKSIYESDDIQIVRYTNEKYSFNLLSKESLKLVRESLDDLEVLEKAGYKDGNYSFSLYDEVLDRIFNNENMYSLIYKLFIYKLTETGFVKTYYNIGHIRRIIDINSRYLREVMILGETRDIDKLVKEFRNYGYHLAVLYREVDGNYENKIRGMSYRMLNSLKTRNSESFMNNVINSHMYVKKSIPQKMTLVLENDDNLGTLGYAFVAGLNGLYEREDSNGK